MSMATEVPPASSAGSSTMREFGPLGRLGVWTASHFRTVLVLWAVDRISYNGRSRGEGKKIGWRDGLQAV